MKILNVPPMPALNSMEAAVTFYRDIPGFECLGSVDG